MGKIIKENFIVGKKESLFFKHSVFQKKLSDIVSRKSFQIRFPEKASR